LKNRLEIIFPINKKVGRSKDRGIITLLAGKKVDDLFQPKNDCCAGDESCCGSENQSSLQPFPMAQAPDEVCCGSPPGPQSSPNEKPGYELLNFVESFIDAPVGPVPRVKTRLGRSDLTGTINARLGIKRNQYKIAPGLYCVGTPGPDSPVLVTANYKLTFDTLRRELASLDSWILVIDTRGINVWCAAGKALFSTREVVQRIKQIRLSTVVRHNKIILPQLAATGVSAVSVKKESGFEVLWGPIRAKDIQQFVIDGCKAQQAMRRVTFTMPERVVLVPVELSHLPKPTIWVLLAVFLLSGIGTGFFSFNAAWSRGVMALTAYAAGILGGAVAAPILLPWIPGRAFALKGTLTGMVAGLAVAIAFRDGLHWAEATALIFFTMAISSYLAMNFTGSTPFTSPSGVEKEMRRAIPLQAAAALIALVAWVGAAFVG
jgi:hypothetical protein